MSFYLCEMIRVGGWKCTRMVFVPKWRIYNFFTFLFTVCVLRNLKYILHMCLILNVLFHMQINSLCMILSSVNRTVLNLHHSKSTFYFTKFCSLTLFSFKNKCHRWSHCTAFYLFCTPWNLNNWHWCQINRPSQKVNKEDRSALL